jgi:hypothetical protein
MGIVKEKATEVKQGVKRVLPSSIVAMPPELVSH